MMTPADTRVLATVLVGVAHGLHSAHEAKDEQGGPLGMVHRDVSPQNVLVGVDGVPRVLDFGVAKAAQRAQTTREGTLKGKLSYMAPEQLHGAPVTRQTDIYAASVVAWEALTGQRLFQADSEAATVTAILQKPVKPPSEAAAHVPLAFDRVVMRGLDRDPKKRYATARELAVELERCVGIAPASEIGEWVERLAHDELLKRASRVEEIEASSSSHAYRPPSVPSMGQMPTTVTATVVEPTEPVPASARSDVSSIAVSPILTMEPRRAPTRFGWMVSVATAVAVVLVAIALTVGLRRSATTSAQVQAAPPPPTDEPAVAPEPARGARPRPRPRPRPPPLPSPHHVAVPRPLPTRAPAADCDPPFTIDAVGHKHYKPACLQ